MAEAVKKCTRPEERIARIAGQGAGTPRERAWIIMSNHVGKTGAVRNPTPLSGGERAGRGYRSLCAPSPNLAAASQLFCYDAAYIVLAEKPALPWSRRTHDWLLPRAMRRPLSCFEPTVMSSPAITGVPHPLSRSSRKGWVTERRCGWGNESHFKVQREILSGIGLP